MKNTFKSAISLTVAIAILALANVPSLAAQTGIINSETTTTALRMQPLVDKYNSLTQVDLDKELNKYSDIKTHWGKTHIAKISALEIISGYGDGKFGPNDKLLGGQYILMLIRAIGFRPEVPKSTPYYKPFVDITLKEGILKKGEISDYTKPITRELAASLARRVIGKYEAVPKDYFVKGVDSEGIGDKGFFDNVYVGYQKLKMIDYTTITSTRLQDVIDCYRMGILTGSNNKFNPKGNLTRAEGSAIIVRLIDKPIRVESVPSASESFKYTNPETMDKYSCSDEYGWYENKEYTIYRGFFPLMEIWDTANAMNKSKDKITNGVYSEGYTEKDKSFGLGWFINSEIEQKYRLDNKFGLILSQNFVDVHTEKTQIKKGQRDSIFDNIGGCLYDISSYDVDSYNIAFKPYVYELMKVWFGNDYEKAKKLHDQYLGYALRDENGASDYYLLNGRQIYIAGGHDLGGKIFTMHVWAKDVINKDTMYKR